MPLVAFSSFDFKGKGYLEATDISEDRISYKMPLTKQVSRLVLYLVGVQTVFIRGDCV